MNVNHSIAGLLQGTSSSYGFGDFVSRPAQERGAFDSQQAVKVQPHSFSFLTQNAAEGSTNVSIGHCTPESTLLSQRSSTFASPFSTYTQSSELCNQVKVGEPAAREGNAGSVCKNKKKRVLFSACQTQELSKAFRSNLYITKEQKGELAARLGLTETQVKIWFQNHRYKAKKQGGEAKLDTTTGIANGGAPKHSLPVGLTSPAIPKTMVSVLPEVNKNIPGCHLPNNPGFFADHEMVGRPVPDKKCYQLSEEGRQVAICEAASPIMALNIMMSKMASTGASGLNVVPKQVSEASVSRTCHVDEGVKGYYVEQGFVSGPQTIASSPSGFAEWTEQHTV